MLETFVGPDWGTVLKMEELIWKISEVSLKFKGLVLANYKPCAINAYIVSVFNNRL